MCAPAAAASRSLALCCVEAAGWPGSGPYSQLHSKRRCEWVVRAPVPQRPAPARMPTTSAPLPPYQAEHRIGSSPSELARLEAAGGRLSRLNQYGSGPSCGTHEGVGPVRLWPGGIMVGRAIGDRDVGGILLPHPHICQVGWGFNGVVRAAVGRAVGLPGMHWVAHIQQSAAGSTACHPPCLLTLHCRCGCRPPAPAWCWPPMGCGTQSRAAVWCACCASTPSPRQQPWRLCRRWPHSAAACSLTTSLVGLLGRGRRRVMADASVVHHPHCGCRVQPGYCSAY